MKKKIEPGALIQHVNIMSEEEPHWNRKHALLMALKDDNPVNQRLAIVEPDFKHVYTLQRSEYENLIHWSRCKAIPMYTDRFFIRYKIESGITYNKKTKTFSVWYGKKFKELGSTIRHDIYELFKDQLEFLKAVDPWFLSKMSVPLLNKCIKGKITNPADYYKYLLKEKFPKLKIPAELVKKIINEKNRYKTDLLQMMFESHTNIFNTCSNVEAFLNFILSKDFSGHSYNYVESLRDTAQQAFILGRKLSYCWSEKKLNDEHDKMSRDIAFIKMLKEPLVDYNYSTPVPHPFLKIINNNRELFVEGDGMRHCVYSNYSGKVADKTYFVFHYDDGETHATVGVWKLNERWKLQQMRTRRNGSVSKEIEQQVEDYLATDEMQEFFKSNSKVKQNVQEDFSII